MMLAPSSNTAPSALAHLINMTTYDPNATYGWVDLGLTGEPTSIVEGFDASEWESQQFGRLKTQLTLWNRMVKTELIEWTNNIRQLIRESSTPAGAGASGQTRINYPERVSVPFRRLAVLHMRDDGRIIAHIFPSVQWSGADIESTLARDNPQRVPIEWRAYVDDNIIDSETGQPVAHYEIVTDPA